MDALGDLVGFLLIAALWFAGLAAFELVPRLFRRRRGFHRAVVTPPPPPSWSLTLLVEVDDDAGLLRPSVQLRGSSLPFGARLRLQVVDGSGLIRASSERSLPAWAIGAELALPAFTAPEGTTIEELLGWHWDLVLEDSRREHARWREHPAPAGALNAEAELDLPGVAAI